jgi:hypothetical protein
VMSLKIVGKKRGLSFFYFYFEDVGRLIAHSKFGSERLAISLGSRNFGIQRVLVI